MVILSFFPLVEVADAGAEGGPQSMAVPLLGVNGAIMRASLCDPGWGRCACAEGGPHRPLGVPLPSVHVGGELPAIMIISV